MSKLKRKCHQHCNENENVSIKLKRYLKLKKPTVLKFTGTDTDRAATYDFLAYPHVFNTSLRGFPLEFGISVKLIKLE